VFLFLQFCRSSLRLFSRTPSTVGPFSTPPPRRASNASFSVRGLLACDRFYFPVFLLFLLVISPVSIGLLLCVMLGPNLWVVDVNVILAFGSLRTSVGLGSQPSVSRNKCWLGVHSP
jgi:hypothetical protein